MHSYNGCGESYTGVSSTGESVGEVVEGFGFRTGGGGFFFFYCV